VIDDRTAIEQLVASFDDAVNRRDAAQFARLWTHDAIWEIGDPRPMRIEGAPEISATWSRMIEGTKWLFRGTFVGVVSVDGDVATGRWPCIETGTFLDGQGYDNRAIYEDIYARTEGGWLFRHRRYLYLWFSSESLPGAPVPLAEELAP
jgi:ketosteroid isomerase-like protein